jgi:hypothetical protein
MASTVFQKFLVVPNNQTEQSILHSLESCVLKGSSHKAYRYTQVLL